MRAVPLWQLGKILLPDIEISNAPILGTSVGVENTYGALDGRTPASPLTYGRISTDDPKGIIKAYMAANLGVLIRKRLLQAKLIFHAQ